MLLLGCSSWHRRQHNVQSAGVWAPRNLTKHLALPTQGQILLCLGKQISQADCEEVIFCRLTVAEAEAAAFRREKKKKKIQELEASSMLGSWKSHRSRLLPCFGLLWVPPPLSRSQCQRWGRALACQSPWQQKGTSRWPLPELGQGKQLAPEAHAAASCVPPPPPSLSRASGWKIRKVRWRAFWLLFPLSARLSETPCWH